MSAPETEEAEAAEAQGGSSLLGALRRSRAQLGETKTIDLDIPGYTDPALVIRYFWRSADELGRAARAKRYGQIKPATKRNIYAAADQLALCCDEIFVRDADDVLVPLARELRSDAPVRFDEQLAAALGVPAPAENVARRMVLATFSDPEGVLNDHALIEQAQKLSKWLGNTSREVDADFLGE